MRQYTRRNNIEVTGLPDSERSEKDEHDAIKLFAEIGIVVNEMEIEACHRVPSKRRDNIKPVIVRFVNRNVRNKVFEARKRLKED